MTCNEGLKFYEMVPVLSYVTLRGRCRNCLSHISIQYPIVEAVTGIVFLLLFWQFGIPEVSLVGIVVGALPYIFFAILIAASVYDIRHFILPDLLLAIAAVVGIALALLDATPLLIHLGGSLVMSILFFVIWGVSKGKWMGFGDVKLAVVVGLILNIQQAVLGLLFSFWIGALWGIFLIMFKGYSRKMQIPFGPFLVLGAFIAFTVGTQFLAWYNSLIGF